MIHLTDFNAAQGWPCRPYAASSMASRECETSALGSSETSDFVV